MKSNKNVALILAGGIGERCKTKKLPKQFLRLNGKEILIHTLEVFENHLNIDAIYVVCKSDWKDYCTELISKYNISKFKGCIDNGNTCLESIYNGLKYLETILTNDDIILIHDGVRPFINNNLITNLINNASTIGNCIPVAKQIETPIVIKNNKIIDTLDRNTVYNAKAPQTFKYGLILTAYKAQEQNFGKYCDSAQIAFATGIELNTIECDIINIKITSRMDFYLARGILNKSEDEQFL